MHWTSESNVWNGQPQNGITLSLYPFSRWTWLAGTGMPPLWILLELKVTEVVVTTGAIRRAKVQSKCHHQQTNTQCCPTNSVKALKGVLNRALALVNLALQC